MDNKFNQDDEFYSEDNILQSSKRNDLLYTKIIKNMNLWELFICQFMRIFLKKQLPAFYRSCGLKKISQTLSHSLKNWFAESANVLSFGFAENLFQLLYNLYILRSLLNFLMLSSSESDQKKQKDPLLIEILFHTLHTHHSILSYPFTLDSLSQGLDLTSVDGLPDKTKLMFNQYIESISKDEFESIDNQYTDWFYLICLFEGPHMDLLKRFNPYISFDNDDQQHHQWNMVTTISIRKHLQNLYDDVIRINTKNLDLSFLIALNESQKIIGSSSILDDDKIIFSWNAILKSLELLQENSTLFNILCMAYGNPLLQIQETKSFYSIENQFKHALYDRMIGMTVLLAENVLENQMQEVVSQLNLSEIGIYTKENNDRFQQYNVGIFEYIYLVPIIKQFVINHLNSWFKNFLSTLVVNVKFVNENDLKYLEIVYRKFNKFVTTFDKFLSIINPHSTISMRILKLLDHKQMNPNDIRMLAVFIESINKPATEVVVEFIEIHKVLNSAINLLISDLSNNTNKYVCNIGSVRNILGDFMTKLYEVQSLLNKSSSLIDLMDKSKNIQDFQEEEHDDQK